MKKMLFGFMVMLMVILSACATTSTIGDGKIDPVETATLRVAVGLAFTQMPSAIAPAYSVSTAILAMTDPSIPTVTTLPTLEDVVSKQIKDLKLDPATEESMYDLLYLIKLEISQQLVNANISESNKMVIVRDISKVIQSSSAARLGIK